MKKFITYAGDFAPYLIVSLVFAVTVSSLVSLVLVDVITGQITGDYLSKDPSFGLFTSLAGTGMLIACGVLISKFIETEKFGAATVVVIVFLLLQSADVYFDALSVDIKRFGYIATLASIGSQPEWIAHNVYRFFVAGISFVGEPLGVGSLVAFPLLKKWLVGILDISENKDKQPPAKYQPKHKPVFHPVQDANERRPQMPMPGSRPVSRPQQRPQPKRNDDFFRMG